MTQESFTIGALAKKSLVNVETIRFYQRRGLLVAPLKPLGSIRRYTEKDVQRVSFIKEAQKLGFSLSEITELLSLEDGKHCQEAKEIAVRKLILIRERIEGLGMMETALSELIESCSRNVGSVSCPIILTLFKASV